MAFNTSKWCWRSVFVLLGVFSPHFFLYLFQFLGFVDCWLDFIAYFSANPRCTACTWAYESDFLSILHVLWLLDTYFWLHYHNYYYFFHRTSFPFSTLFMGIVGVVGVFAPHFFEFFSLFYCCFQISPTSNSIILIIYKACNFVHTHSGTKSIDTTIIIKKTCKLFFHVHLPVSLSLPLTLMWDLIRPDVCGWLQRCCQMPFLSMITKVNLQTQQKHCLLLPLMARRKFYLFYVRARVCVFFNVLSKHFLCIPNIFYIPG